MYGGAALIWMMGRVIGGFIVALTGWFLWFAVIAACAVVGSWYFGVPHVLTTYRYRSIYGARTYLECNYLGPMGFVEAIPGEHVREDCPMFATFELKGRLDALMGSQVR